MLKQKIVVAGTCDSSYWSILIGQEQKVEKTAGPGQDSSFCNLNAIERLSLLEYV